MIKRVLFSRVGWMENYDGAKSRSDWPVGGGSNNSKRCGDEVHNFTNVDGFVYGFCQPAAHSKQIALRRVQPEWLGSPLPGVLVVFVAVDPGGGRQRVVGWYRNATLYQTRQECHSKKRREKKYFYAVTRMGNAVLLRVQPYERDWFVPAGPGGIGQANVCYLYATDGRRKKLRWANQIIKKIENWRFKKRW
jgi:hypothetical protein